MNEQTQGIRKLRQTAGTVIAFGLLLIGSGCTGTRYTQMRTYDEFVVHHHRKPPDRTSLASEQSPAQDGAEAAMKSDKTGTNPVNFTNDARLYNEFLWLNTNGDGEQNITTFEFRTPFAGGKWQFRVRARAVDIEADVDPTFRGIARRFRVRGGRRLGVTHRTLADRLRAA